MIDGYGGCQERLGDQDALLAYLTQLCGELGMHAIADPKVVEVGPMNKKDPGGISGFQLIAESHISFHTFPKRGFVTLDIYTCQGSLDTKAVKESVTDFFALSDCEEQLVKRGTRYPIENI